MNNYPAGAVVDLMKLSVDSYSDHVQSYIAARQDLMEDEVQRFARLLPGSAVVLDVGCGPGRDLQRFKHFGLQVQGVDLNPDFVAVANEIAPTRLGDMRELELEYTSECFDGVWACDSLSHLARDDAAVAAYELQRVLKPTGVGFISLPTENNAPRQTEFGLTFLTLWSKEQVQDLLTIAGFTVVSLNENANSWCVFVKK